MHLHTVKDFAPPGYVLAQTLYEDGETVHRFTCHGQPDLECRGVWATPADEQAALTALRDAHQPKPAAKAKR